MAVRTTIRLLAAAASAGAVGGADACAAGTGAQCVDAQGDGASMLQAHGAARWKRKPGLKPIAEVNLDSPEFDPAEGPEDEEDEVEAEDEEEKEAPAELPERRSHSSGEDDDGDMCAIRGFAQHAGYDGPLRVRGKFWVRTVRNRQDLTFRLHDVDPACENGPGDAPNSCGIRMHEGRTCSAAVGEHHYAKGQLESDPWQGLTYTAVRASTGVAYAGGNRMPVLTGLSREDVRGRAVVVYDFQGRMVACTTTRGFFDGHPPSTNTLPSRGVKFFRTSRVSGTVDLVDKPGKTPSDTGVYLSAQLKGVDAACDAGAGSAPGSCTVSISNARNCRSKTYEDFFDQRARKTSPWTAASYASMGKRGKAETSVTHIPINLGSYGRDLRGRTLVVRDYSGQVIGCGTIA